VGAPKGWVVALCMYVVFFLGGTGQEEWVLSGLWLGGCSGLRTSGVGRTAG
jgi:hypothetical protein